MRNRTRLVSIGLASGWLLLFGGIPLVLLLVTSFLKQHPEQFFSFGFSTESYVQLINPDYFAVLVRSTRLALKTTIICLMYGYTFRLLTYRLHSRYILVFLILMIIKFCKNYLIRNYYVRMIIGKHGLINKLLIKRCVLD